MSSCSRPTSVHAVLDKSSSTVVACDGLLARVASHSQSVLSHWVDEARKHRSVGGKPRPPRQRTLVCEISSSCPNDDQLVQQERMNQWVQQEWMNVMQYIQGFARGRTDSNLELAAV